MDFIIQNWELVVLGVTGLLGRLGVKEWLAKRAATRADIERWARVASDFVLSLILRGVIPADEAVVMDAWLKRFQYLLSQMGLRVTDADVRKARAVALERIGAVLLEREANRLGEEASKAAKRIEQLLASALDRRAPTVS